MVQVVVDTGQDRDVRQEYTICIKLKGDAA